MGMASLPRESARRSGCLAALCGHGRPDTRCPAPGPGGDAAPDVKPVLRKQQELVRYLGSLWGFAQLDYAALDFKPPKTRE